MKDIWENLSTWNIITIVILLSGFYATTVGFRTHVSDFETVANTRISELVQEDKDIKHRVRELELARVQMATQLQHIAEGVDQILEKLAD